jgi:tetratricopeptide (TPR) repeat protein
MLSILIILVVTILFGYQQGISIRKQNQSTVVIQQLTEQFQFVDADIQAGRYDIARQRLEFILSKDPSFPGVQEKLTEVLVQINLQQGFQSPTPTPSPVPTADFSSAQQAYDRAAQLIAAQDWSNALAALDQMRKLDANYQQSQVDGMYYFALRNYGYDLIVKQGNLEGGIYQLTLAERFGPLDRDANGLREGARVYIIGASFWELDWPQALSYFEQARNWGNLWDGTMTASERYKVASMRYGDELFGKGKFCEEGEALANYRNAQTVGQLDKVAQQNYDEAMLICFPATPTFDPASLITPTVGVIATTETPATITETPTETPTTAPAP